MRLKSLLVLTGLILGHGVAVVPQQSQLSRHLPLLHSAMALTTPVTVSPRSRRDANGVEPDGSRATLDEAISVHASGAGAPRINLSDGHELLSAYSGESELINAIQSPAADQIRPLSLAAADLDGDGIPDLLVGFATNKGGLIAIYRGNVDSIYPNSPGALARKRDGTFTDAPFLSPARLFELPAAPDFIETGDFNADGLNDIAVAAKGSDRIYILKGDGSGSLLQPKTINLPGKLTAVASGDVNRRDGITDLVVGVTGHTGPELLVFENPEGVLKSTPEAIPLPAEASAIGIGDMYNDTCADIAVAAGNHLVTVHGRDRKLSMPKAVRDTVARAVVSNLNLPSPAKAMALGKFNGNRTTQAAVLLSDGRLEIAGTATPEANNLRELSAISAAAAGAGEQRLIRASVSGQRADDLILIDQGANKLRILAGSTAPSASHGVSSVADPNSTAWVDFAVDDSPIAVLPMRLNTSARNGLVVLRKGHNSPVIVPEQFTNVFVVNSPADDPSGPTLGVTTLRDAINAANKATAGSSNEIQFDIVQPGPILTLQAALPALSTSNSVTIDGTTETPFGGTPMQINGGGNNVISFGGTANVIKGLIINNASAPIQMLDGAKNIIEGNLIGTLADGITPAPNLGSGILDIGGEDNTIGGTSANAANVIGANQQDGITLTGVCFSETVVGNFVGVDQNLDNNRNLANGGNGIQIESASSQITLGSTSIPSYFNFNTQNGISISSGTNETIVNNTVEGNAASGLFISSLTTQIGGAQGSSLGNTILQNSQDGIVIGPFQSDGSAQGSAQIQGNLIGVSFTGGVPQAAGNGLSGVIVDTGPTIVGGDQASLGNDIGFNGGEGVGVFCDLTGVSILFNVIGANLGLPIGEGAFNPPPIFCPGTKAIPVQILSATLVAGSAPSISVNYIFGRPSVALPNQTVQLQFYLSSTCSCSTCFAGNLTMVTTTVTTDANGNPPSPISVSLPTLPAVGTFVTAISTPTSGSNIGTTSQFSPCVQIGAPVGPSFSISLSPSSISGTPGEAVSLTVNVNRAGGFTGPVTITPPAKANGIKPKPATSAQVTGTSYTLKMKITSAASPGTTQFVFTGTGSLGTQKATFSVTVQ